MKGIFVGADVGVGCIVEHLVEIAIGKLDRLAIGGGIFLRRPLPITLWALERG